MDFGLLNDSSNDMDFDSSALDLGFPMGLGLDYQHDWSDGQQYDIFDGFFFGNSGNSGSGSGNGNLGGGNGAGGDN